MMVTEQILLGQLLTDIYTASIKQGVQEDCLPTAAELARNNGFRLESVKKKLKLLKAAELILPVGMMPKRYRFNTWMFEALKSDHPWYPLFCEPESEYFIALSD